MIVTENQLSILGAPALNRFVALTTAFLKENTPDWCADKSEEEIGQHIEEMIRIGEELDVRKEINIQKLLFHWIDSGLALPFEEQLLSVLTQEGVGEDYRVKSFIKTVAKNDLR